MFNFFKNIKKRINNVIKKRNRIYISLDIEYSDKLIKKERKIAWDGIFDSEKKNLICPICLDNNNLDVVIENCQHWYHKECIYNWLKESNSCPLCRVTIDKNNIKKN